MNVDSTATSAAVGSGPANAGSPGGQGVGSLGVDAFLKLLVTQLQNQDPTQPQSDTEFIAQLAQFSSLEQLSSINKAVSAIAQLFSAAGANIDQTATSSQTAIRSQADLASAAEGKA